MARGSERDSNTRTPRNQSGRLRDTGTSSTSQRQTMSQSRINNTRSTLRIGEDSDPTTPTPRQSGLQSLSQSRTQDMHRDWEEGVSDDMDDAPRQQNPKRLRQDISRGGNEDNDISSPHQSRSATTSQDQPDKPETEEQTVQLIIPGGVTVEDAQDIIDRVLFDGADVVKKKRTYDSTKFDSIFDDGRGIEIWNRFISECRFYFIRYLDIDESYFERLIDRSVGYAVDRNSKEFDIMSKKIREWKKNWFSKYIRASSQIQRDLEVAGPWGDLPFDRLKEAYMNKFSYEYLYSMMSEIHAGSIDWRETLKNENTRRLYKTVFTFTMVYLHRSNKDPKNYPRQEALDDIKLIACDEGFQGKIRMDDFIKTPAKSPRRQRNLKRKTKNLRDRDIGFEIIEGG